MNITDFRRFLPTFLKFLLKVGHFPIPPVIKHKTINLILPINIQALRMPLHCNGKSA